jgi:hypothetical protein
MAGGKWPIAADDADFEPYLAGGPAAATELFWRFIELARGCGPVSFELQPGTIVLRGTRRIFASVRVRPDGLTGHLNLDRQLSDPRIVKVEPLTRRLYFHRYRLRELADLDDVFSGYLCRARGAGDGLDTR